MQGLLLYYLVHTNTFNYMPIQPLFQITLGSRVFPYNLSNLTDCFSFPVDQYQQFVILLCMLQWKVPHLVLFLLLLYLKESILFYFSPLLFPCTLVQGIHTCPLAASLVPPSARSSSATHLLWANICFLQLWRHQWSPCCTSWPHSLSPSSAPRAGTTDT